MYNIDSQEENTNKQSTGENAMTALSNRIKIARQMIEVIANTDGSLESKKIQSKSLMKCAMQAESDTIYGQLMIIQAQLQFCNDDDKRHLLNLAKLIRENK